MHTTDDLKGIHYAIPRSDLGALTWDPGIHQAWNCQLPSCFIDYDTRVHALHLRFKWFELNPSQGVYTWDTLDDILDDIISYGKKATLSVMAGKYTPQWVINNGVVQVNAPYKNLDEIALAPIPHDPIYKGEYFTFIEALGDHIAATPAYDDAVILVKSGLAVAYSGESRILPTDAYDLEALGEEDEDLARDLIEDRFCNAGYREEKCVEAIVQSCGVILDAFPNAFTGIAFVHGSSRYPTNGVGVEGNPNGSNTVLYDALVQVATDYGNRTVSNQTTLTGDIGSGLVDILTDIKTAGGNVAFQLNAQELGYRNEDRDNDKKGLKEAFQTARDNGSLFVEVHDGNMDPHKSILAAENALLRS